MHSDQTVLPAAEGAVSSECETQLTLTILTARLVAAYCEGNRIAAADLPAMIVARHETLSGLGQPPQPVTEAKAPAVPSGKSVTDDPLVCLEESYPLVAPTYASYRSKQALAFGLGHKAEVAPPPATTKANFIAW